MTGPLLMTVSEASKTSGIPRNSLYELVAGGRLESVRHGTRIWIPAAALQRFAHASSNGGTLLNNDEHGSTEEADMEKRDVAIRDFPGPAYDRAKRAAAARGITIGDYFARLVTLHERLAKSGDAKRVLAELGLGSVQL